MMVVVEGPNAVTVNSWATFPQKTTKNTTWPSSTAATATTTTTATVATTSMATVATTSTATLTNPQNTETGDHTNKEGWTQVGRKGMEIPQTKLQQRPRIPQQN